MDSVQLYHLFGQKPFQPVRVHCRNGQFYDIPKRELVIVGVTFLEIGSQAPDGPEGIWGSSVSVPLNNITILEPLTPTAALPIR